MSPSGVKLFVLVIVTALLTPASAHPGDVLYYRGSGPRSTTHYSPDGTTNGGKGAVTATSFGFTLSGRVRTRAMPRGGRMLVQGTAPSMTNIDFRHTAMSNTYSDCYWFSQPLLSASLPMECFRRRP